MMGGDSFMATWSEVQKHVRARYRLQSDTPQHFSLAWQVDDSRPQSFDGDLHVTTQDIHCQPLVAGDRTFLVMRAEVCSEHSLSPRSALQQSARLLAGALVLSGQHYVLRYTVPLSTLTLDDFDFLLTYLVREAAAVHQRVTQRVVDVT
jgi:hypothetical protein